MKYLIKPLGLICICILFIGCNKFKPTKKSSDSFNSEWTTMHWNNATPDKKSIKSSCSADILKSAISNLPKKIYSYKNSHSDIYSQLHYLDSEFNAVIKRFDLESKLSEDTGLTKVSAKDKMYNAWNNARGLKDFIKKVKTRRDGKLVDWGKKEKELDRLLTYLYNDSETTFVIRVKDTLIKDCRILTNQAVTIRSMDLTKITLVTFCAMFYSCKCTEKSSKTDPLNARIVFSRSAEVTFQNNTFDLNTMIFKDKGNPKYRIYEANCCKEKEKKKEEEKKE